MAEAENIDFFTLESMALGKELDHARLKDCGDGKKKYIEARGRDGRAYKTGCADPREAYKSFTIIANYIRWSKDIVSDEKPSGRELWAK